MSTLHTSPENITPYSAFEKPSYSFQWWMPFGWMLVFISTTLVLSLLIALSPVFLVIIFIKKWFINSRYKYHRSPADLKIAIIGGGWGGLQSLDRFKKLGVEHVDIFDRHDDVGGTWHKNLRYKDVQIHGSMAITSFDGLPFSENKDVQGGKILGEEMERYIRRYAQTNDLRKHCQFNSNVDEIAYDSTTGKGTLHITDTKSGTVRSSGPYDMVIWASMAARANKPHLPGENQFRGKSLHSSDFKDDVFDDIVKNNKKVIIIGGSKASCDMALSFYRAGYSNFKWVLRKPYLFYKYEVLLHSGLSLKNQLNGITYLATSLLTGVSPKIGALLHWSSGHITTFGKPHTDLYYFHGGVLCANQRRQLAQIEHMIGEPIEFKEHSVVLNDGSELGCDVLLWGTGNSSDIESLQLTKDGTPLAITPKMRLYNHFILPEMPVFASSTSLWTIFGPMRGLNTAELTVFHLCVRKKMTEAHMKRIAKRQISTNAVGNCILFAPHICWLQEWVYFHFDLMLAGLTPIESFFKHALNLFVLGKFVPLDFKILPK